MVSSAGALLLVVGGLMFDRTTSCASRFAGTAAGDNPWNADTLEWGTSSPPPVYNFLHIPVVEGPNALWDRSDPAPVVTGLRSDCREVLVTDVIDAEPTNKYDIPGAVDLAVSCRCGDVRRSCQIDLHAVGGAGLRRSRSRSSLIGWFWPTRKTRDCEEPVSRLREVRR